MTAIFNPCPYCNNANLDIFAFSDNEMFGVRCKNPNCEKHPQVSGSSMVQVRYAWNKLSQKPRPSKKQKTIVIHPKEDELL